MKLETKEWLLKNGKRVTIREASPEDAQALMDCVKSYLPTSEYIPMTVDEFDPTLQEEAQWIQHFADSRNSILLVAVSEGKIVGNIDLTGSKRAAMLHTAVIGMGMDYSFRNVGLGTALMRSAIDWASQNKHLEILWLQVYESNTAAISLYQKMGFEKAGCIPRFFRNTDQYHDNVTMTLYL